VLSLAASAVVGAGLALGGAWALGAFDDGPTGGAATERLATPVATVLVDGPVAGRVETVAASLVALRAGDEEGAGVVWRDDGHVLTTADLVRGHDRVAVQAVDGTELTGEVVGFDSATDVAVLRVADLTAPGAVLGATRRLSIGDSTQAVTPRAAGVTEVAAGFIASLGVTVTRDDDSPIHGLIGTDLVLSGIEGAALIDADGAVVGLTTTVGGASGIRAVPIDLARVVGADIVATGSAAHPWLGIEGRDVSSEVAAEWGIPGGAELSTITEDGPADLAGLIEDDVVTKVAREEITSMGDLLTVLRHFDPGDEVRIGYLRDGELQWCSATLEPWTGG
jgi:putative serine protease PepD